MSDELPFRSEYAKSSRSMCKSCKVSITQGTLRLGVMVQSSFFDGKTPNWFHAKCFFIKQRPKTEGDIAHFEQLRYEDQEMIKKSIGELGSAVVPSSGKGKKRGKPSEGLQDYGIEYDGSGRAKCRACELKISKTEIRIKKMAFDTEVGMKYGGQALWHHLECFAKIRNDLLFFESGDKLPGFSKISKQDQLIVVKHLPAVSSAAVSLPKKMKKEPKDEKEKAEEAQLVSQNKMMYKFRDSLKDNLTKSELTSILSRNKQNISEGGLDNMLDLTADIMSFGALGRCTKCPDGFYTFNKSGYICTGNQTEWVKCADLVQCPPRTECKIPSDLKKKYPFLNKYKSVVCNRLFKYIPSTVTATAVKKEEELSPKVIREKPPLYNMEVVILGKTERPKDELKLLIQKLGGKVTTKIHSHIAFCLSTEAEIEKMNSRMLEVKRHQIHVVPEDFLDVIQNGSAISYIMSKSLCDWGSDPLTRIKVEDTGSKSKSIYTKSVPKSKTLKLKNGSAVDPDSGLDDVAHVLLEGSEQFNVTLGLTDLQSGKNSYYKLQILESDTQRKYWLFRAWGRIGTSIGGNKLENFRSKEEAIASFECLFEEKTGNDWYIRKNNFIKRPGKMYPVDIDYGQDVADSNISVESSIKSELTQPVQELVQLLFDIDAMKKVMLEFEIDMQKMPLGKLSQKQIQKAYVVLQEISSHIEKGGTNTQFIDASNRFYTLIPHDFGIDNPPLIDTVDAVTQKSDMLSSLLEIEIAYSMLNADSNDSTKNPIDSHYSQLKTELNALTKDSEEFKMCAQYAQNTHAATHNMYELEIEEIFKVQRSGEDRRFKPFKKLHNRQLLWHGSRLTNYVGILSHGLKIAPPEAPSTGYMFGKGIYFADMVSKSANYCATSPANTTGLMLLCEVALGDMYEFTQAKYVTKLPKEKHSTKGIGKTQPDPREQIKTKDGVIVPLGKPVVDDKLKSSLLYNEYIVYDVAQLNVQYLFKMNFKYNY